MTSATVNGNDVTTLDLDALIYEQEKLHTHIKTLMARLEAMRDRVEAAEAAADEADALRMQVRALATRLDGERTTRAMATPSSPVVAEGLREAYEELLDKHTAVTAERDQLTCAREELEARLAETEEIYIEKVANLKAERDDWIAFAEELERELAKEREEQLELEELAEGSMSEGERLRQRLQQTQRELIEARRRRDELQAQVDSSVGVFATPFPSTTPAVSTPPPAEPSLSGEFIDELRDFMRHAADPAPAVLKELRDVHRLLEILTTGQHHLEEILDARLPAAGTWEKLVTRPPTSRRRTRPDEATGIAGQLALPMTQVSQVPDGGVVTEDKRDEEAPPVTIPMPVALGDTSLAESSATEINAVTDKDAQESEIVHSTDVAQAGELPWQERFARIEQAWLADCSVGDLHEKRHFQEVAARVRRVQSDLHDPDALLRALDTVRHRYGDGFSYCLLDGALRRLHRPILNPLLLTKTMRQLSQGRRWHP